MCRSPHIRKTDYKRKGTRLVSGGINLGKLQGTLIQYYGPFLMIDGGGPRTKLMVLFCCFSFVRHICARGPQSPSSVPRVPGAGAGARAGALPPRGSPRPRAAPPPVAAAVAAAAAAPPPAVAVPAAAAAAVPAEPSPAAEAAPAAAAAAAPGRYLHADAVPADPGAVEPPHRVLGVPRVLELDEGEPRGVPGHPDALQRPVLREAVLQVVFFGIVAEVADVHLARHGGFRSALESLVGVRPGDLREHVGAREGRAEPVEEAELEEIDPKSQRRVERLAKVGPTDY